MASLCVSYGAVFKVVLPVSAVRMLSSVINLEDQLPPFLRHTVQSIVFEQSLKPLPCYVGAVSTLQNSQLDIYLFIGSDLQLFSSSEGCQQAAHLLQQAVQAFALNFAPADQGYLVSSILVTWEPNLLTA